MKASNELKQALEYVLKNWKDVTKNNFGICEMIGCFPADVDTHEELVKEFHKFKPYSFNYAQQFHIDYESAHSYWWYRFTDEIDDILSEKKRFIQDILDDKFIND